MGEAAEERELEGAATLQAFARGWLTETERLEVEVTVEMLVRLVRRGEMSPHFAAWLINKLADEMVEAWLERQET